ATATIIQIHRCIRPPSLIPMVSCPLYHALGPDVADEKSCIHDAEGKTRNPKQISNQIHKPCGKFTVGAAARSVGNPNKQSNTTLWLSRILFVSTSRTTARTADPTKSYQSTAGRDFRSP